MAKYRVLVRGENFLLKGETDGPLGFFQTIFVEAVNPGELELRVVDIIRESDLREIVMNAIEDPPMIYLPLSRGSITWFRGVPSTQWIRSSERYNTYLPRHRVPAPLLRAVRAPVRSVLAAE